MDIAGDRTLPLSMEAAVLKAWCVVLTVSMLPPTATGSRASLRLSAGMRALRVGRGQGGHCWPRRCSRQAVGR